MKIISNKIILASWLLLIKTTKMHAFYFFKLFRCFTANKKSPHCYANLKGTLNRYEHVTKVRLRYNVFNLTHSDSSEKVTLERLIISPLHQLNFISRLNSFICWSSQFYNTDYIVTVRMNFGKSAQWPMRSRNVFLLQNN